MSIDLKSAVPQGLELLGTALAATGIGAPAGAIIGGIGELVGHILGVSATPESLQAGLQSITPDQQAALLTLQENNKTQLQQAVIAQQTAQITAGAATAAAELADKNSARARDVEIVKAGSSGGQNWRADMMLGMAFFTVIVIAFLLATGKVDGATAVGGFLLTIGGKFAGNIGTAFDFEFGSSRSSKDKDVTIAAATAATAQKS